MQMLRVWSKPRGQGKGGALRKQPDRVRNWGWFAALTDYYGEHRLMFHGHQLCTKSRTQQALCVHSAALWTQQNPRQLLFAPVFQIWRPLKKMITWLPLRSGSWYMKSPFIPNSVLPCCLHPIKTISCYRLSVKIKQETSNTLKALIIQKKKKKKLRVKRSHGAGGSSINILASDSLTDPSRLSFLWLQGY